MLVKHLHGVMSANLSGVEKGRFSRVGTERGAARLASYLLFLFFMVSRRQKLVFSAGGCSSLASSPRVSPRRMSRNVGSFLRTFFSIFTASALNSAFSFSGLVFSTLNSLGSSTNAC
ncbi:hypothetical protein SFRURICE_005302 [Spodoptera frugiperda]|nr:hypothetical protein SFRURICE_005302 [Spodoptera frugiperda]